MKKPKNGTSGFRFVKRAGGRGKKICGEINSNRGFSPFQNAAGSRMIILGDYG